MSSLSTARDKEAYRRFQSTRQQIKEFMLDHARRHPLVPLSGKALMAQFPEIKRSALYAHVKAIRDQARIESNGCGGKSPVHRPSEGEHHDTPSRTDIARIGDC
jgi:hypothetical protein